MLYLKVPSILIAFLIGSINCKSKSIFRNTIDQLIYLQSRGTQKILNRPMTINDINSSFFRHVQRICYDVLHIKMKLDAPTVKHSGTSLSLRIASSHVGKYIIHFLLYSWGFIICISVSLWLLNLSLLSTHLFTIIIIWCRIIRQI